MNKELLNTEQVIEFIKNNTDLLCETFGIGKQTITNLLNSKKLPVSTMAYIGALNLMNGIVDANTFKEYHNIKETIRNAQIELENLKTSKNILNTNIHILEENKKRIEEKYNETKEEFGELKDVFKIDKRVYGALIVEKAFSNKGYTKEQVSKMVDSYLIGYKDIDEFKNIEITQEIVKKKKDNWW